MRSRIDISPVKGYSYQVESYRTSHSEYIFI